jgi:adenine-specific DNA-methyltransferase
MSYAAAERVTENDIFDNRLIFGDNLLALRALEQEFAGKVKCVYIDPPFNTGEMFENYEDGLEHSLWLSQMSQRLRILYALLSEHGSLFLHLNDDELDYCKVVLDEIFGRNNFLNRITIDARAPSAFSTVNPGVFKASEYILWYAKDKTLFKEQTVRVKRDPDYAYNLWLVNPEDDCRNWQFMSLIDVYLRKADYKTGSPFTALKDFNSFIVQNASRICRKASISDSGAGQAILELKAESLAQPGVVLVLHRLAPLDDVYVLNGQQLLFYSKNVLELDGELVATKLLTNIWSDIAWEGIAGEGGVTFRKGKKPERLIRRCLELATNRGDLVLDSFAGSGTTGAVAHKMGRRWIMIELGEHCHTHIVPRLKSVADGRDKGGISKSTDWKGGGGFRYYQLAPSLLKQDKWGRWVINDVYNPEMLAEAICKLEGYRYSPSDTLYWQHGQSTEQSFIYVTTQALNHEQLLDLSEEVGPDRTLLVSAMAFRGTREQDYPNLTLRKIPNQVLSRCEWGKDDYSLKVENLPAPAKPHPLSLFEEEEVGG